MKTHNVISELILTSRTQGVFCDDCLNSLRGWAVETKKLVTGTVVGAVTMIVVGRLIFDTVMVGFYETNGAAAFGVGRETVIWSALALGTATLAALVTVCIGWSGAKNAADGFKIGGIVGFLAWLGIDLIYYAQFNIGTSVMPLVDSLLEVVRTGIGGAVIASVLGRSK